MPRTTHVSNDHGAFAFGRFLIWLTAALLIGGSSATASQCNFDVDANGKVDALTDGLLILRAGLHSFSSTNVGFMRP